MVIPPALSLCIRMYALKARDKLHKREKEREEGYREERRARAREQHAYHRSGFSRPRLADRDS